MEANTDGHSTHRPELALVEAAAEMFRLCLQDEPPVPFDQDYRHGAMYRRVLEMQVEQCDAIFLLADTGLYRPAYAVLRSTLEAMTTLLWVKQDASRYCPLFESGRQPNMRELLTRIGWEDEYDRTFRYLSGFVHVDMVNADFYRNFENRGPTEPISEILPNGEYFLIDAEEGPYALSILPMSVDEAAREYGPFLAAKTFDIAIAGLEDLFGPEYHQRAWWRQDAAITFTKLISGEPNLTSRMLWSMQKRLF